MSQRQAVTKMVATRHRLASRGQKAVISDELRASTGWHRVHSREALRQGLGPRSFWPRCRKPRAPTYGEEVTAVLHKAGTVMNAPAGKRMVPFLPEIAGRLRACGELNISDELTSQACRMSAATLDRRFAAERKKLELKGRSSTKPGTLLTSEIPIRTWAQ